MSGQKLKSFQMHLKELMQNPEFVKEHEEEHLRLGIAIKLAEIRQMQQMTQTDLAKLSGITQQQLSKLERGENYHINTLLKVCHTLGIELVLHQQIPNKTPENFPA